MCMINEMAARIKELEQQLAETQIAAEGFRAQLMQTRDEMITARHTFQGREQGWKLQLADVLGVDAIEVREGIQALAAQYRKLLDGYPDGMTPTDVEKLKAANAGLADENERVLFANRHSIDMYNQAVEARDAAVALSGSVISGSRMDEIDAAIEVGAWIDRIIALRGYGSEPSAEVRHESLERGLGKVASIWVDNRPVAIAVLLRDTFNRTVFYGSENSSSANQIRTAAQEQQP